MLEIKGKEIKGYSYADGVHWYWGDKEIAIIDHVRSEIQWLVRTFELPNEAIDAIRDKIPRPSGTWLIEARRSEISATQGSRKRLLS